MKQKNDSFSPSRDTFKAKLMVLSLFLLMLFASSVQAKTFWLESGKTYNLESGLPMLAQLDDTWSSVYVEIKDQWDVLYEGDCITSGFHEVCYIRNEFNVSGGSGYFATSVKPKMFFNHTSSKPSVSVSPVLDKTSTYIDEQFRLDVAIKNGGDSLVTDLILNISVPSSVVFVSSSENLKLVMGHLEWKGSLKSGEEKVFFVNLRPKEQGKPTISTVIGGTDGSVIKKVDKVITVNNLVKFTEKHTEKIRLGENLSVNMTLNNYASKKMRVEMLKIDVSEGIEEISTNLPWLGEDLSWSGYVGAGEVIDLKVKGLASMAGPLLINYTIYGYHEGSAGRINHQFSDDIIIDVAFDSIQPLIYIDDKLYEGVKITPLKPDSIIMFQLKGISGSYKDLRCVVKEGAKTSPEMTLQQISSGQLLFLGRYMIKNDLASKEITLSCSFLSGSSRRLIFEKKYNILMQPFVSGGSSVTTTIRSTGTTLGGAQGGDEDGDEVGDSTTTTIRKAGDAAPDDPDAEGSNFFTRLVRRIVSWFT